MHCKILSKIKYVKGRLASGFPTLVCRSLDNASTFLCAILLDIKIVKEKV